MLSFRRPIRHLIHSSLFSLFEQLKITTSLSSSVRLAIVRLIFHDELIRVSRWRTGGKNQQGRDTERGNEGKQVIVLHEGRKEGKKEGDRRLPCIIEENKEGMRRLCAWFRSIACI